MKRIGNWLFIQINQVRTWCNSHQQQIRRNLNRGFNRIVRGIRRILIIGLILYVISSICPEFTEKYPTICGFFYGGLRLAEFGLRYVFSFFYSLFSGHFGNFLREYNEAFQEILNDFVEWVKLISF